MWISVDKLFFCDVVSMPTQNIQLTTFEPILLPTKSTQTDNMQSITTKSIVKCQGKICDGKSQG
jgi:hypothetical protein